MIIITYYADFFIMTGHVDNQAARLTLMDTKLLVPVATLSTQLQVYQLKRMQSYYFN